MPGLVMLSPLLLDQSFPRDRAELVLASKALGRLQAALDAGECHLLVTGAVELMACEFCWEPADQCSDLRDIYNLMALWMLAAGPGPVLRRNVGGGSKHPRPTGCSDGPLVDLWLCDAGAVLARHDATYRGPGFYVGVGCASALAGGPKQGFECADGTRTLPVVGPSDMSALADAYEWEVSKDLLRKPIDFASAHKNVDVIGGSVTKADGGSHYMVKFKGARSWPLDKNLDPIPDAYIDELEPISGYPKAVVRAALLTGKLPRRVLRFDKV